MIKTLYQIGREISKGRHPWEDIISPPKTSDRDKDKRLYVLYINFNLDEGVVETSADHLHTYSDETSNLKKWASLKIQGGNNKATYVSVDVAKPEQLVKTFFGKVDASGTYPAHGQFIEAIDNVDTDLADTILYKCLLKIPKLKETFLELFVNEKGKITSQILTERLKLSKQEKIVLLCGVVA